MPWLWKPAMYAGNISLHLSKTFLCTARALLSQIQRWTCTVFLAKTKVLRIFCLDLKKRDCATSLWESIGWSYLQRRILTFTSSGPPGYSIFCWKASTAVHNQSRRFLKCNDNNFLTQVITEPTRGLAAPHTCKPERACLACEGWEQLWPQWSQDAGVQDPDGWKQHK